MENGWHQLEVVENINLYSSLTSGQHFTYTIDKDVYKITLSTIDITIKEKDNLIYFTSIYSDVEYVRSLLATFFTLQINYILLFDKWDIEYSGLRLLKVDIIECIFAFICSQNNNIKRIKKMVGTLRHKSNDFTYFVFDNLEGFGYRSRYIIEAGNRIEKIVMINLNMLMADQNYANCKTNVKDELNAACIDSCKQYIYAAIRDKCHMDANLFVESFKDETDVKMKIAYCKFIESIFQNYTYNEAESFLMSIKGIGPKVCDCILLNGYGFHSVVPQDVHMLKVSKELGFSGTKFEINEQYIQRYGDKCGIAQVYLFHNSVNRGKAKAKPIPKKKYLVASK